MAARDTDGGLEATPGIARGGRGGAAPATDRSLTPGDGHRESERPAARMDLARVQRAGFGSSSAASAVGAPRVDDAVEVSFDVAAVPTDIVPEEEGKQETVPGVRGRRMHGVAPVDSRRKRLGDIKEITAENHYVDDEIKRRGFVEHAGQWVGGVMLPGEPQDANLAEQFLRDKFRRQLAEQKAEASQDWGLGRRLGH